MMGFAADPAPRPQAVRPAMAAAPPPEASEPTMTAEASAVWLDCYLTAMGSNPFAE
jgi:hypothetical protein